MANPEKFVPKYKYDKKNAGLKVEARLALLKEQGNKCACCGRPMPLLIHAKIDVDRQTNMVRELLCRGCHLIMQGSRDSVERLQKAIAYTKRHKSEEES